MVEIHADFAYQTEPISHLEMENGGGNPLNSNSCLIPAESGRAKHFLKGSGSGRGGGATTVPMNICFPDPYFTCLNLGKRHYSGNMGECERPEVADDCLRKKGKGCCGGGRMVGPSNSAVTCQVDRCHVELVNAREYHKRHKVCEDHAKAPNVELLGLQQRFCQQCSRFHPVSEFDGSKRSCRRRLAGHNERRRKSSQEHSAFRNRSLGNANMMTNTGKHPDWPLPFGRAHSLLSSKNSSWNSASDHPTRCSAALYELIAENHAAILAQQLMVEKDMHWIHQREGLNAHQNDRFNYFHGCRCHMSWGDTSP